ncbi:hypothetical protein KIH74_07810 [Kineosporia sp. J2-2]|uniref:Uncharacterized protein n=1 Tax=Kineosporia corallincola TaxID=2835133 RepID=A0ABS5TCM0_9ACTN|nr:hypothetical protein [Kineosporia corallincola]MBT0768827.1 hypothetical protein [Kineosporia corallincola]
MPPATDLPGDALAVARMASGILHLDDSSAALDAAGNLLHKAIAHLEDDDEPGARTFVARALQLPYDEHEDIRPALDWLQLEMSNRLTEEVELAAEGDSRWLERVGTLLSEVSGPAAAVVRSSLHDVRSDFSFPHREERRLARLIEGQPHAGEPLAEIEGADELAEAVVEVLRALSRQAELLARDLRPVPLHP